MAEARQAFVLSVMRLASAANTGKQPFFLVRVIGLVLDAGEVAVDLEL